MKIIDKLKAVFSKRFRSELDDFWFNKIWQKVVAGVDVNEESALQLSTVYACIRIVSDTLAYLPLKLYKRNGNSREQVTTRLTDILKFAPNPEMSGFRWKQCFMGHLVAWGNAYNYMNRDNANRIIDIWPMRPDRTTVRRNPQTTELEYVYGGLSGGPVPLTSREVWHIPGFGFNGVTGYSVIQLARQGIGLGLAAEEFSARFFGSGTHMGVIVKTKKQMGPENQARLQQSLARGYSGLGKSHKLMVLEEGMEIEKLGIHPEDAALVAQRAFQISDICRWFRIQPHMVAHLDRATFSNITEEGINFARHTITPWAALVEGEMNRYFLTPGQRRTLYFEFDLNGLMRGDFKSRMEGYVQAVSNGIFSRNEVRALENMNAKPGKGGDILTVQLAMTNLEHVADPPEPKPMPFLPANEDEEDEGKLENKTWAMRLLLENRKDKDKEAQALLENNKGLKVRSAAARDRVAGSYKPLVRKAAREIVNKEAKAVAKAAVGNARKQQTRAVFDEWLEEFYGAMPQVIRQRLGPVFDSFAESIQAEAALEIGVDPAMTPELKQWVANYTERYIERHIESSVGQIRSLAEEAMESVEDRMAEWQEKRPDKIATNESVRIGQGMALAVWFSFGKRGTWAIRGPSTCPYCKGLEGKSISSGQAFIENGTEWNPGNLEQFMKIRGRKHHPPLHGGCDCFIIPG